MSVILPLSPYCLLPPASCLLLSAFCHRGGARLVNKPISPWIITGVVLVALGVIAFLYVRPEPRPAAPPPGGMPPGAAAEFGRRMQQWQQQKGASPAAPGQRPASP